MTMDPNKISMAQATSNSSNGKTSGAKLAGMMLIITSVLMGIACVFGLFVASVTHDKIRVVLVNAILFASSGSMLLLGKVIKPTTIKDQNDVKEDSGDH